MDEHVDGYRVIHSFAELVQQPRDTLDLALNLEDALQYIKNLARFRIECKVPSPVKDASSEAAQNIQIRDDELSKMFGKGDF